MQLGFPFFSDMMMELPEDESIGKLVTSLDVSEEDLGTASNFSLASSGLKPQLDSIFSEVEKNLPEIDFDLFDVCIVVLKYSETCVKWPKKIEETKFLMINGSFMKVQSIAECSLGAFCNTFDLP